MSDSGHCNICTAFMTHLDGCDICRSDTEGEDGWCDPGFKLYQIPCKPTCSRLSHKPVKRDGNHDLSRAVRAQLAQYTKERDLPGTHRVEGELPPEQPIEPGTPVVMQLKLYDPERWAGSAVCVSGVIAGINYGRAQNEERNHWRYHVVWASETWKLTAPDGVECTTSFSSERGAMGWPHLWRHDLLTPMRGMPGEQP